MRNMSLVKSQHLKHIDATSIILDVGGRGLASDRSYHSLFPNSTYYVADIEDGRGVTHKMPGPYTLPFDDDTFDLVVSGQMLEHCSNPFKSVNEMKRVLKPNAYIVLIAPSAGPRHDKQDGWRFMNDAFKFIVKDIGNMQIVADWIDKGPFAPNDRSSRWRDHVFVGKKTK